MPDNVIDTSKKISHFLYAPLTFTKKIKKCREDKIKNNPGLIQIPFPWNCKHCSANISLNYTILSSKQQGAMNNTLISQALFWMALKRFVFLTSLDYVLFQNAAHFSPRISSIPNILMTPDTYWVKQIISIRNKESSKVTENTAFFTKLFSCINTFRSYIWTQRSKGNINVSVKLIRQCFLTCLT